MRLNNFTTGNLNDGAILELIDRNTGEKLKQGDKTVLRYEIIDNDEEPLDLVGLPAKAVLLYRNQIAYETQTIVEEENIVRFVITDVLPARNYKVEIVVDNKYVFPSDQDMELEIVQSSLGTLSEIIETSPLDILKTYIDEATEESARTAGAYIHTQEEASDEWVVQHKLGIYPVVDILNQNGEVVYGEVINMSSNHTIIKFTEPIAGVAVFK